MDEIATLYFHCTQHRVWLFRDVVRKGRLKFGSICLGNLEELARMFHVRAASIQLKSDFMTVKPSWPCLILKRLFFERECLIYNKRVLIFTQPNSVLWVLVELTCWECKEQYMNNEAC